MLRAILTARSETVDVGQQLRLRHTRISHQTDVNVPYKHRHIQSNSASYHRLSQQLHINKHQTHPNSAAQQSCHYSEQC